MKLPDWTIKACLFIVALFTVMAGRGIHEDPHETCLKQIARLERELAEDGVLFCMNDVEFDREMRRITGAPASTLELAQVAARINKRFEQRGASIGTGVAFGDLVGVDPYAAEKDPGRATAFNIWRAYQNRQYYR